MVDYILIFAFSLFSILDLQVVFLNLANETVYISNVLMTASRAALFGYAAYVINGYVSTEDIIGEKKASQLLIIVASIVVLIDISVTFFQITEFKHLSPLVNVSGVFLKPLWSRLYTKFAFILFGIWLYKASPVGMVDDAKIKDVKEEVGKTDSNVELLVTYKRLLDEGILTQEEFKEKKKEVLG